jgi:uncharacterized coiled-coil protein SlyX
VQGTTDNANKAIKSLQMIDTKWVKSYKDLAGQLSTKKKSVMQSLDEILASSDEVLTPTNSVTKTTVWSTTVESNNVQKALDHLTELHSKLWDDFEFARVNELSKKYATQGLSLKEVNDLARDYSRNLSAFSTKTGEPLTSVGAKALENTRKWLKQLTRERLGALSQDAVALDDAYHNLADTSMMVDKMVEKVSALWQKVEPRTRLEWIANKAGKWANFLLWGTPKEFVSSMLLKSNQWLKTFNSIDLENKLAKNLKALDEIQNLVQNRASKDLVIAKIREMISEWVKDSAVIWVTEANLWE